MSNDHSGKLNVHGGKENVHGGKATNAGSNTRARGDKGYAGWSQGPSGTEPSTSNEAASNKSSKNVERQSFGNDFGGLTRDGSGGNAAPAGSGSELHGQKKAKTITVKQSYEGKQQQPADN
jgi:hypothetical protein